MIGLKVLKLGAGLFKNCYTLGCVIITFFQIFLSAIMFLVPFHVYNSGEKLKKEIFWSCLRNFGIQILLDTFIRQIIFVLFIYFLVLKTSGFSSRFQDKSMHWVTRYLPRCAKMEVVKPNLNISRHLANISGYSAYFSRPIFVLSSRRFFLVQ